MGSSRRREARPSGAWSPGPSRCPPGRQKSKNRTPGRRPGAALGPPPSRKQSKKRAAQRGGRARRGISTTRHAGACAPRRSPPGPSHTPPAPASGIEWRSGRWDGADASLTALWDPRLAPGAPGGREEAKQAPTHSPSPSLSKRANASLNSAICSSVSWSAMLSRSEVTTPEARGNAGRQMPWLGRKPPLWGRAAPSRPSPETPSPLPGRSASAPSPARPFYSSRWRLGGASKKRARWRLRTQSGPPSPPARCGGAASACRFVALRNVARVLGPPLLLPPPARRGASCRAPSCDAPGACLAAPLLPRGRTELQSGPFEPEPWIRRRLAARPSWLLVPEGLRHCRQGPPRGPAPLLRGPL